MQHIEIGTMSWNSNFKLTKVTHFKHQVHGSISAVWNVYFRCEFAYAWAYWFSHSIASMHTGVCDPKVVNLS